MEGQKGAELVLQILRGMNIFTASAVFPYRPQEGAEGCMAWRMSAVPVTSGVFAPNVAFKRSWMGRIGEQSFTVPV